jgi:hypothetical protein
MLVAEPSDVTLDSEFDFYSTLVVNAKFGIDHSKEIFINDN